MARHSYPVRHVTCQPASAWSVSSTLPEDAPPVAPTPSSQEVAAPSPRGLVAGAGAVGVPSWRRGRRWHPLRRGRRSYRCRHDAG